MRKTLTQLAAFIIILSVVVALVPRADAAVIAFDNSMAANTTATTNSGTLTVNTLSNTEIVCTTSPRSGTADVGVTVNGSAMTQQLDKVVAGEHVYLYTFAATTSGANFILETAAASDGLVMTCASYTGVNAAGVPDASNTAGASAASLAVTVTTVADNSWVVGGGGDFGQGVTTAGSGTVKRNGQNCCGIYDSNTAKTPAGGYTLNQNDSGTTNNLIWAAISLPPFTAAAATTFNPYLFWDF